MWLAVSACELGCTIGPRDHEPRPVELTLVASSPVAGEGTECTTSDPPDCGVPINTDITLRFDRYLRPASAVRQSLNVYTGSPENWVGILLPEYDVVERVVTYRLTRVLEPGTLYTVELLSPNEESSFGFQAFDGGALVEASAPLKFNFFTRRSSELATGVPLEEAPSCQRVLEIFADAGCASVSCHAGAMPMMGLGLDSVTSFRQTALGHVARETEIGPRVEVPLRNPARFGVQMPIVDPGQPGNSYLLYKLLRSPKSHWQDRDTAALCDSRYPVALPPTCVEPGPEELVRLREWFVRGDPMPPAGTEVYRADLRLLQRFIASGAQCN